MNTALIKQLELALAVERGEVPLSEVELSCVDCEGWIRARKDVHVWDFKTYKYRRKPQPREWWCVEFQNGEILDMRFRDKIEALEWMETHDDSVQQARTRHPVQATVHDARGDK